VDQILSLNSLHNSELAEYASQYTSVKIPGIHCVCLSPNGNYLASGDEAGRVTVCFDFDPSNIPVFPGVGYPK